MVLHMINDLWSARLARLRRRVIEQPDGPVWLWSIRIRILQYLAGRYSPLPPANIDTGAGPFDQAVDADSAGDDDGHDEAGDLVPTTLSVAARMAHRCFIAECPPRSSQSMSPLLDELNEINEDNRMRRGVNAPADMVWEWWRTEWLRAGR